MLQTANLIIAGAPGAGKSTFIDSARDSEDKPRARKRRASKEAAPTDDRAAVLSTGQIKTQDLLLSLTEAAPQTRADHRTLWEEQFASALGYVVVVDSAHPGTFVQARYTLETIASLTSAPFVIAANKQDLPGALAPEDVSARLGLPQPALILPCIAVIQVSTRKVVVELLYAILDNMRP